MEVVAFDEGVLLSSFMSDGVIDGLRPSNGLSLEGGVIEVLVVVLGG